MSAILITGGAGYIGSHTLLKLLNRGDDVVVVDNFSNASHRSLKRVETLAGKTFTFVEADVCNYQQMSALFQQYPISCVIHFAGLKAVGESVEQPIRYYQNNVQGTLTLCQAMAEAGVKKLIFSSSATVYGEPQTLPLDESMPIGGVTNPYGQSKLMVEQVLRDLYQSDPQWSICILRYFNPVGAHSSGLIGEDPNGPPNNLMPFISQVAVGKRDKLMVFGDDYDTPDGTGVRDYIHVEDLADGHIQAMVKLSHPGLHTYNLGTGQGHSVLEVIRAFENACGHSINFELAPRRPGDVASNFADTSKAERELNWTATRDLNQMCADSWNWQSNNPKGYE